MKFRHSQLREAMTIIEMVIVIGIIGLLLALLVPAIQRARDAACRVECASRLKNLGLALAQYANEHGRLPPGCSYLQGKSKTPHMSWCTRLLPFVGEVAMWEEAERAFAAHPFFLDRPPHRGDREVKAFVCPTGNSRRPNAAFTYYLGVEGMNQRSFDGVLFLDSRVRMSDIADGSSTTLMLGERPPSADGALGWWYAGWGQNKDGSAEMILGAREIAEYDSLKQCGEEFSHFQQGRSSRQCDALHFWSLHFEGANLLFCDGSVRFLNYSANSIMPALATRAGNESVAIPE